MAKYIGNGKTAGELYKLVEEGWIDWAGPPDVLVADSERGFVAEEFACGKVRSGRNFVDTSSWICSLAKG